MTKEMNRMSEPRERILRKLSRGKRRVVRGIEYRDIILTKAERDLVMSIVEWSRDA